MKSFKEFITEAPWISQEISKEKEESRPYDGAEKISTISKMKNGHIVKIRHHPKNKNIIEYSLHDPITKHRTIALTGEKFDNKFNVGYVKSMKDNPVKVHEFYHHLITHHNIHLHSDYEQSEGGMKVWKKLHKMPGIHMQSFNGSSEKYSELKPSFQRKYDMDSSTRLAAKKK